MGLKTRSPRLREKPGRSGFLSLGPWVLGLTLATAMCLRADAAGQKPPALAFAVPKQQPVDAELIAEHDAIQPDGSTRIGVRFNMKAGWHIYAKDPGDAGLATKIIWSAPPSVSFGPLIWPQAEQFMDAGDIKTFGYTGEVVLYSRAAFAPLRNPQNKYPDLLINADVEWLACKEICLPGKAQLRLALPVSSSPPGLSTHAGLFDQAPPR